ncbi:hypothetical protein HXX25_11810 [Hyphobacterium sp. CCMP332]|uniref:S41 family peptidase n=1 Tax=Hyphobacterium sp. CCMP332 TaxID=2749086 RepID=UPI0016504B8A|nr:S41 family peptidase [Hyphobacterium sp. CCMP332]QNL19952.1 hypothetical protein HXX25_11810 [Hyphobacterium sp. CCMP332]
MAVSSFFLRTLIVGVLSLSFGLAWATPRENERMFSRAELLDDLQTWQAWARNTHPAIEALIDVRALESLLSEVESGLSDGMSRQSAWHVFGRLNSMFNDAHTGIALPRAQRSIIEHPVSIEGHRVFITLAGSGETAELVSVKNQSVAAMVAETMPNIRGESDALRRRILELRLNDLIELHVGEFTRSDVMILTPLGRSMALSDSDFSGDPGLSETFHVELEGANAILTITSFEREYEDRFESFLQNAFAQINESGSDRLFIDLRANGGGARQLSDRLLNYLTSERYTPISAVRARITEENISLIPGAEMGSIVTLPFAQWVQPPADSENRFEGEVYIIVGPETYSQAIVFATIIQDFDIGRIIGEETDGRANQTGQVQSFTLPNTGLEVRAPLYLFTRASGEVGTHGVMPDQIVEHVSSLTVEEIIAALE